MEESAAVLGLGHSTYYAPPSQMLPQTADAPGHLSFESFREPCQTLTFCTVLHERSSAFVS
jgi:hypothetical protein